MAVMMAARHSVLQLFLLAAVSRVGSSFIRTASDHFDVHKQSSSLLMMVSKTTPTHTHDWQFHVAPMQCYTNAPLRTWFQTLSREAILWTEMEKTSDLMNGSLEKRFGSPGHKDKTVLQLGGSDALQIQACLRRLSREGYTFDEVNLNCGCPSIETGGAATYGASLMKEPELTRALLESIVSSVDEHCQLSLKCRTGVVESIDELESRNEEEEYAKLHHYIQLASDAGINHLILHARPAVLVGLNPTKNRQVPPLNYKVVERIANDFSELRVTVNGGIHSVDDLEVFKRQDSAIASHMAGRWMLRRPLDVAEVERRLLTGDKTEKRLSTCIDEYSGYVERTMRSKSAVPLSELCLPLFLVSEQLREDYESTTLYKSGDDSGGNGSPAQASFIQEGEFDELYESIKDAVEMIALAGGKSGSRRKALPDYPNFKKLSASFKGLVGTKVANKWKRNRSEL